MKYNTITAYIYDWMCRYHQFLLKYYWFDRFMKKSAIDDYYRGEQQCYKYLWYAQILELSTNNEKDNQSKKQSSWLHHQRRSL